MRWHLKELIGRYESQTGHNLPYRRIEEEAGLSKTIISRIATNSASRADLETINKLLAYFEDLLGEKLTTNDLLTYMRG